jgi:hypothetical protein
VPERWTTIELAQAGAEGTEHRALTVFGEAEEDAVAALSALLR